MLTVKEIKDAFATEALVSGYKDEALQARYYARPVSYRLAYMLLGIGFTANTVTLLALMVDVIGCLLIAFGSYVYGTAYLNIGHLLDYTDGNIAKATGTINNFGRYFDRTCDELVEVIIPISVGIGLYFGGSTFLGLSPLTYLVIGFVHAVLHSLSAISILHAKMYSDETARTFYSGPRQWIYLIGINVRSSTVLILLVLAFIPNGIPIFLLGFTVLSALELILGVYAMVRSR